VLMADGILFSPQRATIYHLNFSYDPDTLKSKVVQPQIWA